MLRHSCFAMVFWNFCGVLRVFVSLLVVTFQQPVKCVSTGPSSTFNSKIRDYSMTDDNATNVRTMQKEEHIKHTGFVPIRGPIYGPIQYRIKEIPDNALSSSSHSRGLPHDHQANGLHDYEETPYYAHASYGHHAPDIDHGHYDHHGYADHDDHGYHDDHSHHGGHSYHGHHGHDHLGHHGYGHHFKHHDHGISKAILLPVAGLAILGAAAALVSNPVLLQLGVVSGRKRRDTDEVTTGPDVDFEKIKNWTPQPESKPRDVDVRKAKSNGLKKTMTNNRKFVFQNKKPLFRRLPLQSSIETVTLGAQLNHDGFSYEAGFVPVPIRIKKSAVDN